MAEAIFNNLNEIEDIIAASAGLSVVKNSKTSHNAAKIVKDSLNIDVSVREAVQVKLEMLEKSDLILTMTANMKNTILLSFPHLLGKVFTLNEYVGATGDVIDPYGGSAEVYEETFNEIKSRILLLFKKIKEDRGIV